MAEVKMILLTSAGMGFALVNIFTGPSVLIESPVPCAKLHAGR